MKPKPGSLILVLSFDLYLSDPSVISNGSKLGGEKMRVVVGVIQKTILISTCSTLGVQHMEAVNVHPKKQLLALLVLTLPPLFPLLGSSHLPQTFPSELTWAQPSRALPCSGTS